MSRSPAGTEAVGDAVIDRGARTDTYDRARIAADAAASKKGADVVLLDVGELLGITDAFVITHATNTRAVRTIVEEVERRFHAETGDKPRAIEGLDDRHWVLVDYGDVVVHVFLDEARAFYGLERLWADTPRIDWEERTGEAAAS